MKYVLKIIASALIVTSAFLCSCTSKNLESPVQNPEKTPQQDVQKQDVGISGDNSAYYWKLASGCLEDGAIFGNFRQRENTQVGLVRRDFDGSEKVVTHSDSFGTFEVTNDGIYFTNNGCVCLIGKDGKDYKELFGGEFIGITENQRYIIYSQDSRVHIYDIENKTTYTLPQRTTYKATKDNIIYFSSNDGNGDGIVYLYSVNADGTDEKLLCSAVMMYDYAYSSYAIIEEVHFFKDYIYFSYGETAGSAGIYQDGKIAKVKNDGTDFCVVAGEDDTVDKAFCVKDDGSIELINPESRYEVTEEYCISEDTIYMRDKMTGELEKVATFNRTKDDNKERYSFVDQIYQDDKYIYFCLHIGTHYDTTNDIGWRYYYTLDSSTFYMVDKKSGITVMSYNF